MSEAPSPDPDLHELIGLFFAADAELGRFVEVTDDELPSAPRRLLAHHEHMTVTVEEFHGGPVDVEVLATRRDLGHYARKILLRRQRDGAVVQFGVVRLALAYLDAEVTAEILSERIPLGRVLIEHNVLREVQLARLWRIEPGPELQRHFAVDAATIVYGRTALIYCNGEPAVELLEIVTPV